MCGGADRGDREYAVEDRVFNCHGYGIDEGLTGGTSNETSIWV